MQRVFVLDGDPLCPLPKAESESSILMQVVFWGGNARKLQ